ncbi:MAG: ATP-binding protein [Caldilineaceae bacterium]|nr:ATP-binding protein [Caldilineaceae bacterium]
MFVDRQEELQFLNRLLTRRHPGPGQMILLYGRRRVGKTSLLQHWVAQCGLPYTYWVANKESAPLQRRSLFAKLMGLAEEEAGTFDAWSGFWQWYVQHQVTAAEKRILILDELSYAAEADPAMLSALQHAWDQQLKQSHQILVLCGSQVRTMEAMMAHQSPLFGRLTGQWHLQPLPFSALTEFFPTWSAEERVALYVILGGVPAYLEWLDPDLRLTENIRDVMLSPGSMFLAEPALLLYDEVREPQTYLSILRALATGHHTIAEISKACLLERTSVAAYLNRLQELRFVERRLPVTLTPAEQRRSKRGRYHLCDPYFRFYFRFVEPHQKSLIRPAETLVHLQQELRAFVGLGFESLAQQWIMRQAANRRLPFTPEAIGAHWSNAVQIDVVAINRHTHDILLGECKWGGNAVDASVVRELVERKGVLLRKELPNGDQWRLHYVIFARAGFTDGAVAAMQAQGGTLIDLPTLDAVLR